MKKIKKIIALMVAVATLAATAITSCAAQDWLELCFNRGHIEATYYRANNMFHYYDSYRVYDKHIFTFSSVDKTLMEGNVVLTVDFDNAKKLKKLRDEGIATQFMGSLYLKDANGKFITEGKYPLIVEPYNGPRGCMNVMVGHPTIIYDFNLTGAYYTAYGKTDTLTLNYQFKDIFVLPSYNIVLEEISSSSSRGKFSGEFIQNTCGYATINRQSVAMTVGSYEIKIPSKYRGKSFNAYINGMKVGKVTIPYESTASVSYTNY